MEFLEKLIARNDAAPPLAIGAFSNLAALSRNKKWAERCIADMSSVETGLATDLLMRALRSADAIVGKIEIEESARSFFDGASRDVLQGFKRVFMRKSFSIRSIAAPSTHRSSR